MAEEETRFPEGGVRSDDGRAASDLTPKGAAPEDDQHKDAPLDEGLEETFPASDPVAVEQVT